MIPNFDNKHIMQSILNNKVKSLIPNRIQVVVHNLEKEINNKVNYTLKPERELVTEDIKQLGA